MTNLIEWLIWHAVQKMGEDIIGNTPNKEMKDLFAACMEISETGKYLMMERLGTIGAGTPIAKGNFPDWLNDKKDDAFGQSRDGKVKVLDYGMVNFYSALNPLNNRSMFGG